VLYILKWKYYVAFGKEPLPFPIQGVITSRKS